MPLFTPPRDRDAWNIIRGYVYQVDLTIERWLSLQLGQVLELERGEDIDLVSRSLMATSEEEQQRLLEQVKHRDRSVTLREPSAIEAIACAIEHGNTNPDVNLFFRYTTNAQVGAERPSQMPNRIPAISAWEQIRQGILTEAEQTEILRGIRVILQNARQPENFAESTWKIFQTFVTKVPNDEFFNFIHNFEWSIGTLSAQELGPHIQKLLINQEYAEDSQQAEAQYQRLFLHVFKLLSQPGIKQLTIEDREHQLSLPPLNARDRELLDNVVIRICRLEMRVDVVEQELSQMSVQIQRLVQERGINASIDYTVTTLILDIPPLVEQLSRREKAVNTLREILVDHTWLAIHGSVGSGKTQLAILLAHTLGNCRAWIRLRDLTIGQASVRLDKVCETLVGTPPQGDRFSWYSLLCNQLGGNVMLVLDDLPRLSDGDELSERLLQLTRACRLYNVRLLSTSPYPLPSRLQEALGNQTLYAMESPALDINETAEILIAYGMSLELLRSKLVGFVNMIGRQHPSLIVAIARYLQEKNWPSLEKAADELLTGEYTAKLNDDEIVAKILATIEDIQSRELLYRLCLIIGDFSIEDVQAVAVVDPVVERPRERLHNLIGLWVQRDANTRLLVSPLVSAIGTHDLLPETQKGCHLALGNQIVERRQISSLDAVQAITHFCNAEAFDQAGLILISFYNDVYALDNPVEDWGLLSFWSDRALPHQMDLGIRICLRGLQIRVLHKIGRNVSFLVEDLDLLVEQASENEAWAMLGVLVFTHQAIAQNYPNRANHFYLTTLRLLPHTHMRKFDGNVLPISEEIRPEGLIWANVVGITTADHLRDWISTIEQLTAEQRQRAFASELAQAGCLDVADKLWMREADKPKEDQQWNLVLDTLRQLAERSHQLNLELLWACAIRAQIIVLAEYQHDLDTALVTANMALSQASSDPRVQFLIKECVGRQYVYTNRNNEALTWLSQALDQTANKDSYPLQYIQVLLCASRATGPKDPHAAVDLAQEAVSLAKHSEATPEIVLVKALGELTIAHWLANSLLSAFESLDEGMERLLSCKVDTNAWKDAFVLYSHVSGFLALLAYSGHPPAETWNGEPYPAPWPGIFFTHNPARAMLYNEERDCFTLANLSIFAEATGRDDRVAIWALKGIDLAQASNQRMAIIKLSLDLMPFLVLNNRYAEVLDIAIEAETVAAAIEEQVQAGDNSFLLSDFDVEAILGPKPNKLWEQAERKAAFKVLLPITFHISTGAIEQFELAQSYAAEVAALCRQISLTAIDPLLWEIAAELFERVYLRETSANEVIDYSNTIDRDKYDFLLVIGYIGATLKKGITLQNALWAQLNTLPFVYNKFKPTPVIYRRIILPFVISYWTTKFRQMRFRFRSPQIVEKGLSEAQNLPENQQAQSILKIIAFGLDVKLPSQAEEWFKVT